MGQKPAVMSSNKTGWHKIGELTASMKSEKDQLSVMGADKFKSIRIKATDAPIHIASMVIYYESGETQDVVLRSDLKAGEESRVIELKPNDKSIKTISFVYKTVANAKNDKAHLEVYGLK